MEVMPAVNITQ
jgi:hypothetical protein